MTNTEKLLDKARRLCPPAVHFRRSSVKTRHQVVQQAPRPLQLRHQVVQSRHYANFRRWLRTRAVRTPRASLAAAPALRAHGACC
jgi:hypothetical protein